MKAVCSRPARAPHCGPGYLGRLADCRTRALTRAFPPPSLAGHPEEWV